MSGNKKKKDENLLTGQVGKNPKKVTPPIIKKAEEEKPEGFDFGGLPQRDLKKNLGCG
ncbi:MAG TPA: hypothetical protein VIT44_18165 [Cyclobacteriaceae bacterium]